MYEKGTFIWIFKCIVKVRFRLDNLESTFVAIELKKLLNSFAIALLPVTTESFIYKQIGANLVWASMFINTFISCQNVFFLFFSNRFLKKGWLHN